MVSYYGLLFWDNNGVALFYEVALCYTLSQFFQKCLKIIVLTTYSG